MDLVFFVSTRKRNSGNQRNSDRNQKGYADFHISNKKNQKNKSASGHITNGKGGIGVVILVARRLFCTVYQYSDLIPKKVFGQMIQHVVQLHMERKQYYNTNRGKEAQLQRTQAPRAEQRSEVASMEKWPNLSRSVLGSVTVFGKQNMMTWSTQLY